MNPPGGLRVPEIVHARKAAEDAARLTRVTRAQEHVDSINYGGARRDYILALANDPSSLESYAASGATREELAVMFDLPVAAIALFDTVLVEARARLSHRIREAILEAGDKGDAPALAYLEKTYLRVEGKMKRRGRAAK